MSIRKLSVVVLQGYDTGDTSEVVRVFCAEHGRLAVMAKGLRRAGNRFAAALQPLNGADLVVSLHDASDMATLREATLTAGRDGIRADLERLALASVLAEAASESAHPHQPARAMFDMLALSLAVLEPGGTQPPTTAAAHALLRLVSIAGYEPHIAPRLLKGGAAERPPAFWLGLDEGMIDTTDHAPPLRWPCLPAEGVGLFPLPPQAVRAIYENQRAALEDVFSLPALEPAHARQLIEAAGRLLEAHLGHGLRSLRFWRSVA